MPVFFQVMIGSALGGLLRYLCTLHIPMPILTVNVIGSFIIGFATVKLGAHYPQYLPFINIGILGGLTTFSSFSMETVQYVQEGKFLIALAYVLVSIIVSLAACYLGFKLG